MGSDIIAYTEVLPGAAPVHAEHPAQSVPKALEEAFQRNMDGHPLIAHARRTGDTHPVALSDLATKHDLSRLAIYAEFFRPLGVEDQLAVPVPNSDGHPIAITFNRGSRFTPRDHDRVATMGAEFAMLRDDVQHRRVLDRALSLIAEAGARGSPGVLVIDRRGRVDAMSPSVSELIGELWNEVPRAGCAPSPRLARWLERSRRGGPVRTSSRGRDAVTFTYAGAVAATDLFLVEREAAAASQLTPRQHQLLREIAKGHTDKQIGHELGISPRTVQKHLERTYRALRVSNRTEAVARWYETTAARASSRQAQR